jgi:hypothetical protein
MPDYKPNQFVRAFAVLALIAAVILVGIAVATSGGGDDSGGNGGSQKTHVSKTGRQAVSKGFWIVRTGDTLGKIALKTGIDQTTLETLNPDIDPQTLHEGQRIALR